MLIYNKLKSIRRLLSLSQTDIEADTGLSQRDISQLENGKKKFIPTSYIQFLNKKGIPLGLLFDDTLPLSEFEKKISVSLLDKFERDCNLNCNPTCNLSPDLASDSGKTKSIKNRNSKGKVYDKETSIFLPDSGKTKGSNIIELPVPVCDTEDMVSVPVVDISVAAGDGFENPAYLTEVDCVHFPKSMIKENDYHLCVRIKGDSMAPTLQDGGYLIIRLLDRSAWEYIRDEHIYVISDREGRSFVKRVKNRLSEKGFIVCMSDNPDVTHYRNFNLYGNELNSVWYAEWYISAKMPNIHTTYYRKVSELEDKYDDVITQLQQVQKVVTKMQSLSHPPKTNSD